MNYDVVVPLGWNALEGRPQFEVRFAAAPTEVMLSEVTTERMARITMPLAFEAQAAVARSAAKSHDVDEAEYHANRPSMKHCPFDNACRFV